MFTHIKTNQESTEVEKLIQAFELITQTAVTHRQLGIDLAEMLGDEETAVQERIKLRAIQVMYKLFDQCQTEIGQSAENFWHDLHMV